MAPDADEEAVLAIDPGRDKCGLAVVTRSRTVRHRAVVARQEVGGHALECLQRHPIRALVLGRGTGHREVAQELKGLGLPLILMDEGGTTLAARRRYFQAHPPRGWRSWIPLSMQVPPEPFDDWVAVLLAERYWQG